MAVPVSPVKVPLGKMPLTIYYLEAYDPTITESLTGSDVSFIFRGEEGLPEVLPFTPTTAIRSCTGVEASIGSGKDNIISVVELAGDPRCGDGKVLTGIL